VALPAYAAARCAAARLLVTAGPPTMQQSIGISWSPGPQQQTRSSGAWQSYGTNGRTDGRATDV